MCEEFGSGRNTFMRDETKECTGTKGGKTEDKTCNQKS